jgi:hypothetical protein
MRTPNPVVVWEGLVVYTNVKLTGVPPSAKLPLVGFGVTICS